MKISINLTDEHIKLIKNLRYIKFDDNRYGVDNYAPWAYGGSSIFEDMALILGFGDKIIPETRESPFGAICEETTQRHLEELDAFFIDHMVDIEEILHQMVDNGGIKAGKYTCLDNVRIWKYEG